MRQDVIEYGVSGFILGLGFSLIFCDLMNAHTVLNYMIISGMCSFMVVILGLAWNS